MYGRVVGLVRLASVWVTLGAIVIGCRNSSCFGHKNMFSCQNLCAGALGELPPSLCLLFLLQWLGLHAIEVEVIGGLSPSYLALNKWPLPDENPYS